MNDKWKVFETATMIVVARSTEEVFNFLLQHVIGDIETIVGETDEIKEIDLETELSLTFVDDTEINESDYSDEFKITFTDEGQPVLSAPCRVFVEHQIAAGDVPAVLACTEY